jgi:hypothetical protein
VANAVYIVQGFEVNARGMLKWLRPSEAPSKAIALRRAEALAGAGGAVVVDRPTDPDADEFTPPNVIARFGEVPRDLGGRS